MYIGSKWRPKGWEGGTRHALFAPPSSYSVFRKADGPCSHRWTQVRHKEGYWGASESQIKPSTGRPIGRQRVAGWEIPSSAGIAEQGECTTFIGEWEKSIRPLQCPVREK